MYRAANRRSGIFQSGVKSAWLEIEASVRDIQTDYRCRIDFEYSTFWINLGRNKMLNSRQFSFFISISINFMFYSVRYLNKFDVSI